MRKFFGVALLGMLLTTSCRLIFEPRQGSEPVPLSQDVPDIEYVDGQVSSAALSALGETARSITISSLAGSSALENGGDFTVASVVSDGPQLLFALDENEAPILVGLQNADTGDIEISVETTALAVILMNPYLIGAAPAAREAYLDAAAGHASFPELLTMMQAAFAADPHTLLDPDVNPAIFQTTAVIMREATQALENESATVTRSLESERPRIVDAPGADVIFLNQSYLWLVAGVYEGEEHVDTVVLNRRSGFLEFNWDWPPVAVTDATETRYPLGDGVFDVRVHKGGDFSRMSQFDWDDPVVKASILNLCEIIKAVVSHTVGHIPMPDAASFGDIVVFAAEDARELTTAINNKDGAGFVTKLLTMISEDEVLMKSIAKWIFHDLRTSHAKTFLKSAAGLVKKATFVLEVMGFVNNDLPFVLDLMFAPRETHFSLTQYDGEMTYGANEPPIADLAVSPDVGTVETLFSFDATESYDPEGSALTYRYQFGAQQEWTQSTSEATMSHQFETNAAHIVSVEVTDRIGLIDIQTVEVSVGGGAGTADHIILFKDADPWSSSAMTDVLQSAGFTAGYGSQTYEIVPSSEMGSVVMTPGEDLVVISNDQPQSFYDNYAENQSRFHLFVVSGGSLFFGACDQGWSEGSMEEAGVVLPGNIKHNSEYLNWNYVTESSLPLVSGLPDSMDHNYASHESFSNLPAGTIVYLETADGEPTLIEAPVGRGWVFITGQPLEHQFAKVYGQPDLEELLPRIIHHFTDRSPFTQPRAFSIRALALDRQEQDTRTSGF